MDTKLAQHFTYGKLLKFVFPSIVMMVFTSIYGVVDGLFVSNFVGKTAFASINLIMPFIMGLTALGFMMGTGGSAIVAKTLGEGKPEKANEYFSLIVYTTIIGGLILSILGMFLVRPVSILLGAEGELLENCVLYGRITFISLTAFMLQNVFQSFFVTATKPKLGLAVIVSAGVTNKKSENVMAILNGALVFGIAVLIDFLYLFQQIQTEEGFDITLIVNSNWGLVAIITVVGVVVGAIVYFGTKIVSRKKAVA